MKLGIYILLVAVTITFLASLSDWSLAYAMQ